MNSIQKLQSLGQEIWLDNIRRSWLKSGEMQRLVDTGISGLTANPTILERAIIESDDYDEALKTLIRTDKKPEEIYEVLAIEDIRASADLFRLVFERTQGKWGFASLEINPLLAYGTEETVKEGKRLFAALDRPNVMVKVPATPEGIPAIRRLTAEGVNVNVTLIFSLDVYREVAEAYISGLEEFIGRGGTPNKVASVASFFLSRIDTVVDKILEDRIQKGETRLKSLSGTAATASAKLAYQLFRDIFSGERFESLRSRGARVQRPLWASTGTKNPHYSDVKYVEPLIGPDTVNTLPLETIKAFLDHGKAENTIDRDISQAKLDLENLREAGINLDQITQKLLADGVQAFSNSFETLMAEIEKKRSQILEKEHAASTGRQRQS